MIYTMTFNPALDYIVKVDDFKIGNVNRTSYEEIYVGGKGINVSIVLKNLDISNKALGYIAGFTGDEIQQRLNDYGCENDFIKTPTGLSRINLKLKSTEETEINGIGPIIDKTLVDILFKKLDILQKDDIVVLAGSIPNSISSTIYEDIMKKFQNKGVKFIVDATKDLLKNVLKYKPFLVKPNHYELAELFDVKITCEKDIIKYATKLKDMGASNVIISMAGEGAIFISEDGSITKCLAPKGILINSVGAGDSMVAGFIAGFIKNGNLNDAFKMGIATGSASAFSDGLATKDKVLDLLQQIK